MGKIKRARQKFHQSSTKNEKLNVLEGDDLKSQQQGKSPLLKTSEELSLVPDNLFEGIDINFDNLKKKLTDDDRISVRSIVKSCKYDNNGKLLTKKEKQKLKHDLFMRKINTVQQMKKEALLKNKKRKSLRKSDSQVDTIIHHSPLGMELSLQNETSNKNILDTSMKREKKSKLKGIKKTKVRQKEMLQDIAAFRKLLTNFKSTNDLCGKITECVQSRILKERR